MTDDLQGLTLAGVTDIVDRSLAEDAPWGDATSEAAIPATATATARIVSRVDGTFAGGIPLELAFTRVDPARLDAAYGTVVDGGWTVVVVGDAAAHVDGIRALGRGDVTVVSG